MASFIDNLFASVKSVGKILLQSRPARVRRVASGGRIVIMGNGPSLADTIADDRELLVRWPSMSVNFAANAPVFRDLKPRFYVLADPHFFNSDDSNVALLWKNIGAVDWAMTLYVPARFASLASSRLAASTVAVERFNNVGVEGFGWLEKAAYRSGLGMPRPRNVLIPSIMLAMAAGFDEIVITGADHSWMKTLSVTDDNEVVSVQPHFYKEDKKEEARVRHEYRGYALHTIVESFAVAFRSYWMIRRYADSCGVRIVNATPGSFIDAFPRAAARNLL